MNERIKKSTDLKTLVIQHSMWRIAEIVYWKVIQYSWCNRVVKRSNESHAIYVNRVYVWMAHSMGSFSYALYTLFAKLICAVVKMPHFLDIVDFICFANASTYRLSASQFSLCWPSNEPLVSIGVVTAKLPRINIPPNM